ncbi:hypothetical protein F4804DRAFT_337651 [Jackrogersella minutella]|nr:hypothetical protein F4804DRAFT_337651 [Jackrogersella minutella]
MICILKSAAVLRTGQVCGPSSGTGIWNTSEWVPSLVISSKFLGDIPDSLGIREVNWVSVDKLGDIVTEIVCVASRREDSAESQVYNVVNPATTSWEALLPALKAIGSLDTVPASEWIDRLEKSEKGPHVISENPAAKIIDFYKQTMVADESMAANIETHNLLRASQTAVDLAPINQGDMARWIKSWGL